MEKSIKEVMAEAVNEIIMRGPAVFIGLDEENKETALYEALIFVKKASLYSYSDERGHLTEAYVAIRWLVKLIEITNAHDVWDYTIVLDRATICRDRLEKEADNELQKRSN